MQNLYFPAPQEIAHSVLFLVRIWSSALFPLVGLERGEGIVAETRSSVGYLSWLQCGLEDQAGASKMVPPPSAQVHRFPPSQPYAPLTYM